MEEEVIYFELNNWEPGTYYPEAEPFYSWMELGEDGFQFDNKEWVKQNKLCVSSSLIDMSFDYRITAPKSWVEKNCPDLLTKYTKFIKTPGEDGIVLGRFGYKFLPYSEKNIGVHYVDDNDLEIPQEE